MSGLEKLQVTVCNNEKIQMHTTLYIAVIGTAIAGVMSHVMHDVVSEVMFQCSAVVVSLS